VWFVQKPEDRRALDEELYQNASKNKYGGELWTVLVGSEQ